MTQTKVILTNCCVPERLRVCRHDRFSVSIAIDAPLGEAFYDAAVVALVTNGHAEHLYAELGKVLGKVPAEVVN